MNSPQLLTVFLLLGMCQLAFAEWKQIIKTYQSIGYADLGSIQKRGDIVAVNVLIDYAKSPFDGNNLSYRSLTLSAEYHCTTKQYRTLKLTSYSGNMGTGNKPYHSDEPSDWQPVSATSIQNGFWKLACEK